MLAALGRSEPASSSFKSAAASDSDRVTSLDDDLDTSAAEGACTSIIQLPAVLIPHVQSLLEFLYEGHTLVTPRNAGPLLVLADRFMVPGLDSLLLAFIEQWTQPFENIHNRMELDPQLLFYTLKLAQLFPAHLASAHEVRLLQSCVLACIESTYAECVGYGADACVASHRETVSTLCGQAAGFISSSAVAVC